MQEYYRVIYSCTDRYEMQLTCKSLEILQVLHLATCSDTRRIILEHLVSAIVDCYFVEASRDCFLVSWDIAYIELFIHKYGDSVCAEINMWNGLGMGAIDKYMQAIGPLPHSYHRHIKGHENAFETYEYFKLLWNCTGSAKDDARDVINAMEYIKHPRVRKLASEFIARLQEIISD